MMENNNELQWQDLVVYNGNQKQICFAISQSDDVGTSSSSSNFRLATDQLGYFHPNKKSKSSVLADPMKKSRSLRGAQTPCCQVEGCNIDLKGAKEYHRRHRICESHSKSPRVIVKGMERRFCQQCSRFHELSEFDDKKRSCRRRLSDHNARRRRVHMETIHLHPPKPSFYDIIQMQQNGLLNRLPFSQPEQHDGRIICFSNNEIHNSVSNIQMDSTTSIMDQCLHVPLTSNYMRERDLLDASSLLSTNSWSMNHSQATTMDSLFNGNAGFSTMHRTSSMGFTPAEEAGNSSRSLFS